MYLYDFSGIVGMNCLVEFRIPGIKKLSGPWLLLGEEKFMQMALCRKRRLSKRLLRLGDPYVKTCLMITG